MEIFNEIMNSVNLYGLLTLTEFTNIPGKNLREYQGWLLVLLCMLTVFVNIIYMLINKFKMIIQFARKTIAYIDKTFCQENADEEENSESAKKYQSEEL
jgi:hypothetical protein